MKPTSKLYDMRFQVWDACRNDQKSFVSRTGLDRWNLLQKKYWKLARQYWSQSQYKKLEALVRTQKSVTFIFKYKGGRKPDRRMTVTKKKLPTHLVNAAYMPQDKPDHYINVVEPNRPYRKDPSQTGDWVRVTDQSVGKILSYEKI